MNAEKYNIVLLGPAYPYRGGIASFTERLAREFNSAGHHTLLCTFNLQYPSFLFPGKSQFSDSPAPKDLTIKRWINSINPFNWFLTGYRLNKLKPDLVIVRYWMPFMSPAFSVILSIVKKNKSTRIICIADNIVPHEKRLGDKILTSIFTKVVDTFIVMSEKVKNDIQQLNIQKPVTLIAHPLFDHFGEKVDPIIARKELGLPTDKPILLFFGLIRSYKGLDLLIKAMSDERIRKKEAILLIAGEYYENKKKYLDLIAKEKLQQSIIIHDRFIAENRIQLYFSAADVLVQPYKTATQSGVTPLSMHFDLPMIVTTAGGLKEMVLHGETGIVTDINDKAIADGIIEYLNKGKDRFVPALQKQKSFYSWKHFVDSVLSTYKNI